MVYSDFLDEQALISTMSIASTEKWKNRRNERMFLVSFLVLNTADNPRQLGNNIFQAGSIAQKDNCQLTRLDCQQEEGLMSCLPLGLNQIEICLLYTSKDADIQRPHGSGAAIRALVPIPLYRHYHVGARCV